MESIVLIGRGPWSTLGIHICYIVQKTFPVQKTLDIYSVQDSILDIEVYRDNKGSPSVLKFMSEPQGLQMLGVCSEQRLGYDYVVNTVAGL